MGRRPLQPHADRLIFMSRDLFCCSQAASSHDDQQGLRHLRSRGLEPIHWCSLRFSKVCLAATAVIAWSPSVAPIAHSMGLSTVRIRTQGQAALFLPLWHVHASPPIVSLLSESLPIFCFLYFMVQKICPVTQDF